MKQGISVILLAGGHGTRMESTIPKQYFTLGDRPIARHSFDLFLALPEIDEIVVVCAPEFEGVFAHFSSMSVKFASPGKRRQDSVYNGLQQSSHPLICIHDAARPFIDVKMVLTVLEAGEQYGAATVGSPIRFTIKEADPHHFVHQTPDRSKIWEIQTPQVLSRDILTQGFQHADQHNITVTDDVSLAELIGKPVKLVEGSAANLKITTRTDLAIAHHILASK